MGMGEDGKDENKKGWKKRNIRVERRQEKEIRNTNPPPIEDLFHLDYDHVVEKHSSEEDSFCKDVPHVKF